MNEYDKYKKHLSKYLKSNKDYPRSIVIEVTPLCNLRCVICACYIPGEEVTKDRRTTYLSFDNFRRIIKSIKGKFNFQICFSYSGESLLHPEIFKMVKYLKENKIPVVIYSNAMLLTKQKIKEILESGLDRFIVSFDGASKKTYEGIRKGARFEVVVNNVRSLIKERTAQGLEKPFVEMQMVVTKTNINESELYGELSKEIGVDNSYLKTLMVFQDTKNKEYIKKVEGLFIDNEIARYKRNEEGNLVLKNTEGCPELQNCAITCDGDVVPCCFDLHGKYCLGNAIENSLKDIWDGKRYKYFRENAMNKRKLPICRFCNTSIHISKRLF